MANTQHELRGARRPPRGGDVLAQEGALHLRELRGGITMTITLIMMMIVVMIAITIAIVSIATVIIYIYIYTCIHMCV